MKRGRHSVALIWTLPQNLGDLAVKVEGTTLRAIKILAVESGLSLASIILDAMSFSVPKTLA